MPDTPRLVLASASPARLSVLRAGGLDPEVIVSGVDERAVSEPEVTAVVAELARRKAEAVARRGEVAGALVLGCDSLLDVDGQACGKPATADEALARWRTLRGRAAVLRTGHHLVDTHGGGRASAVASTVVHFGDPTDEELAAYVATGEPLQLAGGFSLEGRSAPFVDGVEGDPGNVLGLSLPVLRRLLGQLGHRVVDLWR